MTTLIYIGYREYLEVKSREFGEKDRWRFRNGKWVAETAYAPPLQKRKCEPGTRTNKFGSVPSAAVFPETRGF